MKNKALSLFFAALMASTFIHEIRAKARAKPGLINQVHERVADPVLNCNKGCNDEITGHANITTTMTANEKANLLDFANLTAKVGIIVDVNANISVILNGTTGAAIVINLAKNEIVYISVGIWIAAKISFKDYVASLTSGLTILLKKSGAVVYKNAMVPAAVLREVNSIVLRLIINITNELKFNDVLGLQIIITISASLVHVLGDALIGFTSFIGSQEIQIKSDLAGLLNMIQSFGAVASRFPGGLNGLKKGGVVFDPQSYSGLKSGLDRLINIILAIGTRFDIGAALGSVLNDTEKLFKLIGQLGGNENTGLSGLFKVLGTIVAFLKNKLQLEVVISVLIQFLTYSSQTANQDLSINLNQLLNDLLKAVDKAGATKGLSGLVAIVTALLKGTLTINGINISVIIKILLDGVYKGKSYILNTLVTVILELKTLVDPAVALIYCLLVLFFQLNSFIGIQILKALGINVFIEIQGIICFIIKSIIPNIYAIPKSNLYNFLINWPVVGQIIWVLNGAVKEVAGEKYNFQVLVNGSTLFRNRFVAWIWLSCFFRPANFTDSPSPMPVVIPTISDLGAVKFTLETITSVYFYLSINSIIVSSL